MRVVFSRCFGSSWALRVALLFAVFSGQAVHAHGLMPQRVYVNEPGEVYFVFRAINLYTTSQVFDIEVFYSDFETPIEFAALPLKFNLAASGSRQFKVRFMAKEKGLYFVCTRQILKAFAEANQTNVSSRVCARLGVGVKPE